MMKPKLAKPEQIQLSRLEKVLKRLFDKNLVVRNQTEGDSSSMIFRFCWGYEEALQDIATFFEINLRDEE